MSQPVMSPHADLIRYDIRRDRAGWTVYDVRSGAIAVIDGVLQVGLDMDEADAVADALSLEIPSASLTGIMPRFAWFQAPARP
ncbi:hypothetical protein [Methylobacterium frigidaeris]|uniref:Uncharacterized protein n=1 Tax=Methylobacterium frigidaeris TaxID=2038277 RepID=A0AA37H7J0_9HYPH|nr:hypothetical protein [Methylobacterium frigidaeris]GJD60719.1 hypothetical protein MPEAHAMD_0858 [Methylobacterium frigidaeris]